jgi:1,2-dihydroxy-3-keto-5-methylthiopentene dioxygenase
MTLLQVMADTDAALRLRARDPTRIAAELAARDVVFDRWPILPGLDQDTPSAQILAHYADYVAELNADSRYRHIDVARLHPNTDPRWDDKAKAARAKFLSEHWHAEDEVRFFVAGQGCFYLHRADEVVALVCEGGDLVSLPAGMLHWFDMGVQPEFVSIRFFEDKNGWVGKFTGETIDERFPLLDQLVRA